MNQLSDEKSEESSRNDSASGESSSHSTTNNQVRGIEEGDITVVNERYIFSVKDQSVFVTDAGNPRKLNQVAKLTPVEEGYVHKLLLHENLLLVVVEDYTASKQQKNNDINMTKVFIYDIEKPTNPELVRIVGQEGSFTNIRKVGQRFL